MQSRLHLLMHLYIPPNIPLRLPYLYCCVNRHIAPFTLHDRFSVLLTMHCIVIIEVGSLNQCDLHRYFHAINTDG